MPAMQPAAIPLSLYVHIPWCVRKCPYCDFNSHERQDDAEPQYVAALIQDVVQECVRVPSLAERDIVSVFFGGGTPSLFSGASIQTILDGMRRQLRFASDCEITLETNPGTAEYDRFEAYLEAGVNRLSFGIQSFDPAKLKRLGRIHDEQQARAAVRAAQRAGFANINLDLMYALPEQTLAGALQDVAEAIALGPIHLSHYQLTLEPNTLFAAKPPPLPDDDLAYDMQLACQDAMAAAGFTQYEVSAYAAAGRQARHNRNYWQFGDYIGLGAGAHGKLTLPDGSIIRSARKKLPRSYLNGIATNHVLAEWQAIPKHRLPFEFMLNALRLNEGFAVAQFAQRTGLPWSDIQPQIDSAIADGLLELAAEPHGTLCRPTELGRRFLNDLIERFLPDESPPSDAIATR
ncbi:YggW family oxidoreductase [Ahniella affigens]|uniref:Heme chaperone HemW n=1 Tax=Ahniella affigens TaxID=2021234 RepID=A0A2P1PSB9_9GAMM|nr:radical SAM family heme chaperone HemW [Ahniella affigens]AVP97743.1 YggW family oxidoreductase [Ahniella affigens]